MNFDRQVVLVTGASSGIGRCVAVEFAKRGALVIGCGRSRERLQRVLDEVRRSNPSSVMLPCDVGMRQEVESMMRRVLTDFGKIDVLVNNAGVGTRKPFVDTSLDTVEEILRTNYLGMVYCTHAVLPSMIARRSGHIVNISSVAGHIGSFNLAAYSASKFAMNGFSESLYHELKPFGIHVSVICPGPVRTAFSRSFAAAPPRAPQSLTIEPEAVSTEVIRVVQKRIFETVMPRSMALACGFKRLAPGLFRALFHRVLRSRTRQQ